MRQPKLQLSPRAEADLVDIGSYIADDNPARAMSFVLELHDFMQKVAASPYVGRPRDDLHTGLRSVPFIGYNHVIYYRVMSRRAGIKVERVLHGARDVGRLL